MSWAQRAVVVLLSAAAAAGLVGLPLLATPYQGPAAWDGSPQFDAGRAWAYAEALATRFPRRWSGSPGRAEAADWIAATLGELGLEVHRDSFPVALGQRQPVVLENVWGIIRGSQRPDEVVVALGNYDMAPTSIQAASDTAGHVGTLLELARVVRAMGPRRTFVFLFPDGEEWGMLGARRFAKIFPERRRIVAALSIEDLDVGRLRALGIDGMGQFSGFAPMWLRALAADASSREGFPVEEVAPLFEWLQRSILISWTDQGPFLGENIPAIDLAGRGADRALQNRVYHLPGDTMENMRRESVDAYGRIQERLLRAIDGMAKVPRETDFYLRLEPGRIVSRPWLPVVQIVVFLPLVASVVFRVTRGRLSAGVLGREALETGSLLFVLLAGLQALKSLPRIGLMPWYELYPPPPRHPMLTDVQWVPVLVVAAVIAAAAWLVRQVKRSVLREGRRAPGRMARPAESTRAAGTGTAGARTARTGMAGAGVAATLIWLLLVVEIALLDNPFGAVTFLLLPAFLWIWIELAVSLPHRAGNAVLVGAGFLVLVALMAQYGQALQIGAHILWYLFMSLAYGQFSLLRIVLALATVAMGMRLLALGSLSRGKV